VFSPFVQAKSKLSQIQQSPEKPGQGKSKKKAWICLDFLGGIEPFQWFVLTPRAKKSLPAPFPVAGLHEPPRAHPAIGHSTMASVFRKEDSARRSISGQREGAWRRAMLRRRLLTRET
jgi:hypothetical protein